MKRIFLTLFSAAVSVAVSAQTNGAQTSYQLGRDAIAHGEAGQAVSYFEKAVAEKPTNADYRYQLAKAYELSAADASMMTAMPLAKKMKAELERAIQLDPNLLSARFALLNFHLQAPAMMGGSEASAIEQADAIRKRDAIDGHRAFARIQNNAKKPDLARKEYDDMVREQPASARAHYYFGLYLMTNDKNYKLANDEFELALRLDGSYMPACFQVGHVAALASDNYARGEQLLKKYLSYTPKDDEPAIARDYFWLGSIYEKQGRKADAKSSYVESMKINPHQKDVDTAIKRVS